MKKTKRITKVLVETERTFIFRSPASPQIYWCEMCGAQLQVETLEMAAKETGLSELMIYRLVEACTLHFTEDAGGHVLVCLNSLRK